jgi:hypothetical protein
MREEFLSLKTLSFLHTNTEQITASTRTLMALLDNMLRMHDFSYVAQTLTPIP